MPERDQDKTRSISNSRAYGIVRDPKGPSLEVFDDILAHHKQRPREIRVHAKGVHNLLSIAEVDDYGFYVRGIPIKSDPRILPETALVVFPSEGHVPRLVFWAWGAAAAKGGTR